LKTVYQGLLFNNDGQGMTEYGLILGVFLLAVIGAAAILGPKIIALYTSTNNLIK
jgi:pilus assembly protein Flp/PilA